MPQPFFAVQVSDQGPGIRDVAAVLEGRYHSPTGLGLGLTGTRRLMDRFAVETGPGKGTVVRFGKALPAASAPLNPEKLAELTAQLTGGHAQSAYEELQQQNQELLAALDIVRRRESELARLNQELEETNRGVVALYGELDDKAEALRRANEIKSRFLSHMSHEFRTPLNSILALTNLLANRVDGDLTPNQEKQVGYVRRAAEELFEMVNDLLDLAKVESGRIELHMAPTAIATLFGTLRAMLRPLTANTAVELHIEEPPADLVVQTDDGKLTQILRNLVSNALKFTERGEVRVSCWRAAGETFFSVSDTGIGIAAGDQERIFEDFAQVEHPIQRKVKGTGLGLSLSRKLAELLGGRLTVISEPGQGSTFTLALPASDQPKVPVEPGFDRTILVVDDEEVSRYLVRQIFRNTRYRVIEAASGTEASERARFDQPSLILLDLMMPDRNGFEVLEELKSHPSTQAIPVVIHTSRVLRPEDQTSLAGRHAAVLPKHSADREQALALIAKVLNDPGLLPVQNGEAE
jgi:signal transduction histidine kinase